MSDYIKQNKYHPMIRTLHWLMAVIIIILLAVGLYLENWSESIPNIQDPNFFALLHWHKSFGILILALVLLRIVTRITTKVPEMDATLPNFINLSAKLGHYTLYALMILQPLNGILMSQFADFPAPFFFVNIPPMVAKNIEIAKMMRQLHTIFGYAFIAIITLHILAALWHRYIIKKDVFYKMWW